MKSSKKKFKISRIFENLKSEVFYKLYVLLEIFQIKCILLRIHKTAWTQWISISEHSSSIFSQLPIKNWLRYSVVVLARNALFLYTQTIIANDNLFFTQCLNPKQSVKSHNANAKNSSWVNSINCLQRTLSVYIELFFFSLFWVFC